MYEMDELKNRLQHAMDINGKKAVDLSRDLGIPKSAISQYLNGKSKNMTADRLHKIAKYLDVSEAWLMGYDVSMERNQGINADGSGDDPDPLAAKLIELLSSMTHDEKRELLNYIQYLISRRY